MMNHPYWKNYSDLVIVKATEQGGGYSKVSGILHFKNWCVKKLNFTLLYNHFRIHRDKLNSNL